ncbi:MAG: hypothetical protein IJW46_08065, partial [Clostridia bacterium]|nr:hypothetical protein [Clostridia bacterium]
LSHGGLFEDWLLTVSLCGTAMSELLVLIYTVAGGLALFHSKSMITRRPSTLATLAKVDRVIVRASLFRDRASDGVTVLRLPSGEEETLSPMLSEDASRILRNAMIALGATARLGAQNAFVYGVKGLDDMVSEAFKKAELYLRAESYTVISADRTESGMYYGVFQRNGRYFLSLLAPTDQLLPLCSFGYRNNTIVGLSESSRRQAGKTVSEQGTVQYYGVAIGHLTDAVTETLDDAALSHLIEGGLVYEGAIGVFYKVNSCQPLESALSALNVSLTVMEDSEPIPRGASEYMPSPTRRTVYETIRAEQEAGHTVLFHAEALSDLALMKEADLSFTTGDAPSRERAIAVSGDQDGELLVHAPKVLRLFADWLLLKDKPDAAGSAIAHAIEDARGRYYRVLTALCYLFTVLPMKLVPLIGALITGKSLVSPILLFLLGLVFDTLAVMALLFKPCRERQKPYAIRVYCRQILAALGVGLLSGGCLLAGALVAEGVYLLSLELFATVLFFAASLLTFLTHYVSFEEGKRPRASLSLGTLLIVSGSILLFVLIFTRGSLGKGGFLCLAAALGEYLVLEGVSRLVLHRNMRKTSKRVQKSAKKCKKTSKKIDKTS